MSPDEARERVLFARGVLTLLADTRLFGPLVDKAIEGLDDVAAYVREPAGERSS